MTDDQMIYAYQNLETIGDFKEFSNARHYVTLPSDWSVLVAHVTDSAQAIEDGRYRDVNNIGAACIMAIKNSLKGIEFPYVFAGESATIVLPENHRLDAVNALLSFARLVEENYQLSLAVGSVPIHELEREGAAVEVARYEIHAGMCIALFRGGGIKMANEKVKGGQVSIEKETDASQQTNVDLSGMTCRWNKIPSKNGRIMTILVYDNPKVPGEAYEYVANQIDSILSRGIANANPTNCELATYKSLRQILREERRFHASACSLGFILRAIDVMITVFFTWTGIFAFRIKSMRTHADYRKFDDMLRMVVDCTQDQGNAIEFMLQDMHQHDQKIFYGVFYSTHSLMACLNEGYTDGSHIHFIDCDNGGYAMAAQAMKDQMQQGNSANFVRHGPILNTVLDDDEASLDCNLNIVEEQSLPFDGKDEISNLYRPKSAPHTENVQVTLNFDEETGLDFPDKEELAHQQHGPESSLYDADAMNHRHDPTSILYHPDDSYDENILAKLEEARLKNLRNETEAMKEKPKKKKKSKKKKKAKKVAKEEAAV